MTILPQVISLITNVTRRNIAGGGGRSRLDQDRGDGWGEQGAGRRERERQQRHRAGDESAHVRSKLAHIVQVTECMVSGVNQLTGEVDMLAGGLGLVDGGADGGLVDGATGMAEVAVEKVL